MEKENIEKKLFVYSLFSEDTKTFDVLVMGFDDKATIEYYCNSFNDIYKSLSKYYVGDKLLAEKNNFIDKIHNSTVYRVGYFDKFKGCFINELCMLANLFDFEFTEEEIKEDVKE